MIKLEENHNCNIAKMQNLDIWTLNYPILHLCLAKYYIRNISKSDIEIISFMKPNIVKKLLFKMQKSIRSK